VLLCGLGAVALAIAGVWAAALIVGMIVIVLLLPLAVLHFTIRLVTRVDTTGLHLRVLPVRWSMLPRRMAHKDVPLAHLRRWEVRTYNSLTGREYWGWHLWGLAAGTGGRYLYLMHPNSPITGRGVAIEAGTAKASSSAPRTPTNWPGRSTRRRPKRDNRAHPGARYPRDRAVAGERPGRIRS
jgi:hypothetical protein